MLVLNGNGNGEMEGWKMEMDGPIQPSYHSISIPFPFQGAGASIQKSTSILLAHSFSARARCRVSLHVVVSTLGYVQNSEAINLKQSGH